MSDECVKTHYSAQELADLSLPGIPSTRVGIAVKAKRDKWASRVREMKGGGVEYHIDSLPTETQKALRQRLAYQVLEDAQLPAVVEQKAVKNVTVRDELEVMVKCPELALREVQALTDKQKAIADARIAEVALPVDASPDDVQDVKAVYATQAASELASVAMAILVDDAQSEQLIPADIGRLVGDVRTRLQAAITLFRERYEGERERITETASPLGLMYPEIIQSMKNVAATVQDVGLLVLSRRPPLTQKQVQADSCLLLLAWQWYGDYSRAAELQRLNPQLRDPNNITAGVVINAYAK